MKRVHGFNWNTILDPPKEAHSENQWKRPSATKTNSLWIHGKTGVKNKRPLHWRGSNIFRKEKQKLSTNPQKLWVENFITDGKVTNFHCWKDRSQWKLSEVSIYVSILLFKQLILDLIVLKWQALKLDKTGRYRNINGWIIMDQIGVPAPPTYTHPNSQVEILTPVPVFGDKIFEEMTKLKWGQQSLIQYDKRRSGKTEISGM